jgi:hypothetical protein
LADDLFTGSLPAWEGLDDIADSSSHFVELSLVGRRWRRSARTGTSTRIVGRSEKSLGDGIAGIELRFTKSLAELSGSFGSIAIDSTGSGNDLLTSGLATWKRLDHVTDSCSHLVELTLGGLAARLNLLGQVSTSLLDNLP